MTNNTKGVNYMSNGMGSQDDEMTRREQLRTEQLREATENAAVAGSSPDESQNATCTDADTEQMLAAYKQVNDDDQTMTKEKQKLKSPRYSDVPAYSLQELDTETLKDEVFDVLEFSESEKQAAGALVNYAGENMTQAEIAGKSNVSSTTISRVKRSLVTQTNPTKNQRETLRYARENPDASSYEVAEATDSGMSLTKTSMRAFRNERIVCEVEVDDTPDETQETQEQTTVDDEQDVSEEEEQDDESDLSDAVKRDLAGDDDVTYKYDTDSSKPKTLGGKELTSNAIDGVDDLLNILREQERRLQEVESRDPEQVPKVLKGRIASLETRVEGVQSVADRIEDQQAQVERFVEEQYQGITDSAGLEWEETSLGQRVERIEDALETHKDAIDALRERVSSGDDASSSFVAEEKKDLIVVLAEQGRDDLIERVIEEL